LLKLGVAPDRIYTDHRFTGTNRARPGLDQALAAVRSGDTLVVPKLDRLARSVSRRWASCFSTFSTDCVEEVGDEADGHVLLMPRDRGRSAPDRLKWRALVHLGWRAPLIS
jgi:hypothetical protein